MPASDCDSQQARCLRKNTFGIGDQVTCTSVPDIIFLEVEAVGVALEGAAIAAGIFASDLSMAWMFIFCAASCSFIILS